MENKKGFKEKLAELGRLNFFLKVAIAVFLCACAATIFGKLFEYNQLLEREEAVQAKIQASKDNIEELNLWLDKPYDDDYVISIARDKLNLRRPEEMIFYNDLIK